MIAINRPLFMIAVSLTLPACAQQLEDGAPDYGKPTSLRGQYFSHFETSAIALCTTPRDRCAPATEFDVGVPETRCWVAFTKRGYEQLNALRGESRDFGSGWLEGRGRIARGPGSFGHLSAYPCEVEIDTVSIFDNGSPHINRPPPPGD